MNRRDVFRGMAALALAPTAVAATSGVLHVGGPFVGIDLAAGRDFSAKYVVGERPPETFLPPSSRWIKATPAIGRIPVLALPTGIGRDRTVEFP